ncbi:RrF2 family transcriptional regulator [Bacillus solitudinis]|uniref:RrF2 family transcriptional regulator n=1 Tax=Bacillus solitudinis TaxID=2014074 RepID=UPI0012FDB68F|nr:Rrf2 family transcriptional regulator [Bacillus solitudinis]
MQLVAQTGDLGPSWFHVSLRALVLLAGSEDRMKSNVVASKLGADPTFVRKILSKLSKVGIVISKGGREGGYTLGKHSDSIRVGEIYRILSSDNYTNPIAVRPTGVEPFISELISSAETQFQSVLDSYTLSDLVQHAYPIYLKR